MQHPRLGLWQGGIKYLLFSVAVQRGSSLSCANNCSRFPEALFAASLTSTKRLKISSHSSWFQLIVSDVYKATYCTNSVGALTNAATHVEQ
jgi:hypothetical protein